jgi:hypothetical protein
MPKHRRTVIDLATGREAGAGARENPALTPEQLYWTGIELATAEAVKALRGVRHGIKARTYHAEVQRGYRDAIDRFLGAVVSDVPGEE